MNKIQQAFGKNTALIACLTGGDPSIEKTGEYIREMAAAGADIIEISIPFSDPTAEGTASQNAGLRALETGCTADKLFSMLAGLRGDISIPLLLTTYVNPAFRYGYPAFFARCRECGVEGVVLPDLPFEEQGEVLPFAEEHGVEIIPIVAHTSGTRVPMLVKNAQGFVYAAAPPAAQAALIASIRKSTSVPVVVDFDGEAPAQGADGIRVAEPIARLIGKHGSAAAGPLGDFLREIKKYFTGSCAP